VNWRAVRLLGVLCTPLLWPLAAPLNAAEPPERSAAELMDVLMWNREPVGGAFRLVDHTGKLRRDTDYRGRLLLLYFGFTFCPDVCPTDLQAIAQTMERLGKAAEAVQPLFVTLDPERDTPARLAPYVTFFHPRLVGLTGDAEAIREAANAYKVYYAKVPSCNDYTIDHSGYVYLMDRSGKYLGFFPPGTPPERMVEVIRPFAEGR